MGPIDQLEQQAVDAAIRSLWDEAIKLNKQIVTHEKNNLSAYLRLGFAYLQKRNLKDAKTYYSRALKLQPTNNVAKENIERIKILEGKHSKKDTAFEGKLDPNLFLEIPGKTKSVTLVNLGQKNTLARLNVGQEVILAVKKRKVEVRTLAQEYIGTLPDDLSRRLLLFLNAKSKYIVHIKEASLSRIIVFIKEEKKGRQVGPYLSFPSNIQSNIQDINSHKDEDANDESISESDIDRLAEHLTTGETEEYLPYQTEESDDADEE